MRNYEYFLARKVAASGQQSFSRLIIRIAIVAIALSVSVMIVATALIAGFKNEISDKIFGFWGHVHITDTNLSSSFLEAAPIDRNQDFYPFLDTIKQVQYTAPATFMGRETDRFKTYTTEGGIGHIQVFALKAGIIQTKKAIEGIILKGVDRDFNWEFLQRYLVEGEPLNLPDSSASDEILVSRQTADRLELAVGDRFIVHFVEQNEQLRRAFTVSGIYKTGLEEYDSKFALVDIRKIQQLLKWTEDQVGGFEVFIDDIDDLGFLTEYIYLERLPPELYAESIREKFPNIFEWLELQDINEVVILALMLVVGIINMITALMILILERTNMIGTLKALGSTNWSIRRIFLYYAGYIILLGLFWGNLIGLGLCWLQDRFEFIKLSEADYYLAVAPVDVNFWLVLLLNILTLVVTLLFLIVPSWLVTRINPVRAIRFK
ncbi:MAG: ABC transporter permease [Bacteroidetes bacterium]|nr:ABC transporter permease [Bacteroidota bacterium]